MKIVFAGAIGRSGLGGQTWSDLQYLLGLRELGHDVFYLEDCGTTSRVYDWDRSEFTFELDAPAAFVAESLDRFRVEWTYRTDDECRGARPEAVSDRCKAADLLVVRGVPIWTWRPEYEAIARRVFIDIDPGFTQVRMVTGDEGWVWAMERFHRHFTIGQRIGTDDCPVPTAGLTWFKTTPPVVLSQWPTQRLAAFGAFTTVMNWRGFDEFEFAGVQYGLKDKDFPVYLDLPALTGQRFEPAVMGVEPEVLEDRGWHVHPSWEISKTIESYRDFIQASTAEFSVPKNAYRVTRGGWFSDRSVCYLASGRPVVVGDTGLDWLPIGEGLITFDDVDGAVAAVGDVVDNYQCHAAGARKLAEDVFDSRHVLSRFLEDATT